MDICHVNRLEEMYIERCSSNSSVESPESISKIPSNQMFLKFILQCKESRTARGRQREIDWEKKRHREWNWERERVHLKNKLFDFKTTVNEESVVLV